MEFNFGDRVCVVNHIVSYSVGRRRDLYGTVGVIVDKDSNRYGVKLAGLKSKEDAMGLFWFRPNDIMLQEEMDELDDEKTVLVGDLKNGYSYVTAKEAEELRMLDRAFNKVDEIVKSCTFINGTAYIPLHITKVIFNNPATIVFWSDGKKTVVKCAGDEAFDEEKGLAMAISKRVLGNQGNYYNEFKQWLPKINICEDKGTSMVEACRKAYEAVETFNDAMRRNAYHSCNSCKHVDTSTYDEPCKTCLASNKSEDKYEPKKEDK